MKKLLLACAFALTPLAAEAQTAAPATPPDPTMVSQVQHLLAADWRPVVVPEGGNTQLAFQTACAGATEEVAALHSRLHPNMTVTQFREIRNEHGLIIIPGHTPSSVVFFPNTELAWIAGGQGSLLIVDIDRARIDLRDSQGGVMQLQLAQAAGGQPIMRVLRDDHPVAVYVACVATAAD